MFRGGGGGEGGGGLFLVGPFDAERWRGWGKEE